MVEALVTTRSSVMRLVFIVAAVAVFVAGVVTLMLGVSSESSADRERNEARTALADAHDDLDAASADFDEVYEAVDLALERAETLLPIGEKLHDEDVYISDLIAQIEDVLAANDLDAFYDLADSVRVEIAVANEALEDLGVASRRVVRMGAR